MERERPDWNNYFLDIAEQVSKRGTCKRRIYGAVIVNKDNKIISTGYCGNPSGVINCCKIEGPCHREKTGITSGTDYSSCHSIHAEENAIDFAGLEKTKGCTIYIVGRFVKTGEEVEGKPCHRCRDKIIHAGIKQVVIRLNDEIKIFNVDDWREEVSKEVLSHYQKE